MPRCQVLRSFLPSGGSIVRVSVYPSDFGLARMKDEEEHGPRAAFGDAADNRRARARWRPSLHASIPLLLTLLLAPTCLPRQ
jgi:hypothetical protein